MAAMVRVPIWPSETPILYPARSRASWARRTTSLAGIFTTGRAVARLPADAAVLAGARDLRALPRTGCFLRGGGACRADIGAQEDPRSADRYIPRLVPR